MKNKHIAQYAILSMVISILGLASGGGTYVGFATFAYYAGMLGFYFFTIWGWVRLIKSEK